MLIGRVSMPLAGNRALQWLPLVLGVLALGVMQARLLPVRTVHFEIPATIAIGAAPEYSVAPVSTAPANAPTAVLPSESQPPAETALGGEFGSSVAAPGAQRIFPQSGEAWADRLPPASTVEEGAGNLKLRANQPSAISTLVASIMKSLSRIHPSAELSARALAERMAVGKTQPKRVLPALPTRATPAKPNLAGQAIGGAAPQRNILGGPATLATSYAPIVGGANIARYR